MKRFLLTDEIGRLGEDIACRFLAERGFSVLARNYWKKWGEIDIIAKKAGKLYFFEVKTVSRENILPSDSRETFGYRPEENVHPQKLKRIMRTVQSYLLDENVPQETLWQLDVLTVILDRVGKNAAVERIEDVVLS